MSRVSLQTLSVKRKRNEEPPTHLMLENASGKRQRKNNDLPEDQEKGAKTDSTQHRYVWRRMIKIPQGHASQQASPPAPPQTPTRRYRTTWERGSVVLLESRDAPTGARAPAASSTTATPQDSSNQPSAPNGPPKSPTRKRPGASARSLPKPKPQPPTSPSKHTPGPSAETILAFEKFSHDIETSSIPSPSRIKPKAPKQRYRDRHPTSQNPDAMDIDQDYVYDTYVREILLPDANGNLPSLAPSNVGLIVLTEEDEEWWYDADESDREFDTDDEDSNAEEFYANDYPEDELSSDDEFERDPYVYYNGDEEFDLKDGRSDDEDEEMGIGKGAGVRGKATFWGTQGEVL